MGYALANVERIEHQTATSNRSGLLTVLDVARHLPPGFAIRRAFWVYGVAAGTCRGQHAHRHCSQALVAMAGTIEVAATDGRAERRFRLAGPGDLLLIPPLVWSTQTYVTVGAVLCVFCDEEYREGEYIRDFEEYRLLVAAQ